MQNQIAFLMSVQRHINEINIISVVHRPHQKVKFQSFIRYFDWLESQATSNQQQQDKDNAECQDKADFADATKVDDENTYMKVSRKVFSGKQWLTIEDWLECTVPLCALDVKHESRIERSHDNVVQTVFASPRLGGDFLSNGWSQVCIGIHFVGSKMAWLDVFI